MVFCMGSSFQKFGNAAWVVLERRRPAGAVLFGLTSTGSGPARRRRQRRRRRGLRASPLRGRLLSAIAPEIGEVRVFEEREPLLLQGAHDVRVGHPGFNLGLDDRQKSAKPARLRLRSEAMQGIHLPFPGRFHGLLSSLCPVSVQCLSRFCPVPVQYLHAADDFGVGERASAERRQRTTLFRASLTPENPTTPYAPTRCS